MSYHKNQVIDWMQQHADDYADAARLAGDAANKFGVHPQVALSDDFLGLAKDFLSKIKTGEKQMKSQFTNEQIKETMKSRGITRKSALKFLNREHVGTKAAPQTRTISNPLPTSLKTAAVVDVKARAANDTSVPTNLAKEVIANSKPEVIAGLKAGAKKAAQPKASKEQINAARNLGIQQFNLAGRPTKEQFIQVYGPRGKAMSWVERIALGVGPEQFQEALKSGRCVAPAAKADAKS